MQYFVMRMVSDLAAVRCCEDQMKTSMRYFAGIRCCNFITWLQDSAGKIFMGRITRKTIIALRNAASSLEKAADYQWGHMGSCNCGFLAREIACLDKAAIHQAAMQRYGNWTEQLNDYCPASGLLMDDLISLMLGAGFDIGDLRHLETLSNTHVLRSLPSQYRFLQHNVKADVIIYLRGWASWLESQLDEMPSQRPLALHDYVEASTLRPASRSRLPIQHDVAMASTLLLEEKPLQN